jgi:hypothetical protein
MAVIIGIDPGKSGGLSAYDSSGPCVHSEAMPETMGDMHDLLLQVKTADAVVCMEELSGYVGGVGNPGSAMFTMAKYYWPWEAWCHAYGMRLMLVRPMAWQKALGCGKKAGKVGKSQNEKAAIDRAWKNHLKEMAQRLYPDIKVTLKNSDSLLILEYARRELNLR